MQDNKVSFRNKPRNSKLVKFSPRKGQLFDEMKDDIAPGTAGVRVLSPTRWTVRAGSMLSFIQNYTVLNELWDKACSVVGDTQAIACIRDATAQMASFEFFLYLYRVRCFYTIPTTSVGRFSTTMCQLLKVKL